MLRAFLLTENTLIRDGDFCLERLLERVNDFSDIYGNLITRSLSKNMAGPVVESQLSRSPSQSPRLDQQQNSRLDTLIDTVTKYYDACSFSEGFNLIMAELRQVNILLLFHVKMNLFFNDSHPWTMAKAVKQGDYSELQPLEIVL